MIKIDLSEGDNPVEQIKESLKIISRIDDAFDKREKISLDLSGVKWVLPCTVILISGKLREILCKGADVSYIPPKNLKVKEWLSDIGFPLGKTKDGSTFISIKHFANNLSNPNQVNEEANSMLKKIETKIPNSFGGSILYILGELADNIDQHSNFTHASLMAQYFPQKEYLDIAVLDNGISIPFNFEKNNISFKKDSEAIKKALSGEATTKKDEKMRAFGLKSCKDISIKGFLLKINPDPRIKGELHVVSRKGIAILKSSGEENFYDFGNVSLDGTFLYFRLPTPKNKIDIYYYLEG